MSEEQAEEHDAAAQEAERRQLEHELLAAMQEEMRRIPVGEYLVGLLVSLSSMAFQRLGVTAETVGDRDLDQSRLAIDAFSALVDVLAEERPADEIGFYRNTLHQMRMAYVRATGTTAPSAGEETAQGDDAPAPSAPETGATEADGESDGRHEDEEGERE